MLNAGQARAKYFNNQTSSLDPHKVHAVGTFISPFFFLTMIKLWSVAQGTIGTCRVPDLSQNLKTCHWAGAEGVGNFLL